MVPVVISPLGVISDKFEKHIEKLGVMIAIYIIQKKVLLDSARILQPKSFPHKANYPEIRKCSNF